MNPIVYAGIAGVVLSVLVAAYGLVANARYRRLASLSHVESRAASAELE